ncbi:alpha/beta hydrolase [Saccharopolyspora sp. NPDC050389]|uniref:esterase/lipase family protein n=1 Tax=Saccharopolyspora sp. NPDC050389 TaxID=3155516 RepID=UPI003405A446
MAAPRHLVLVHGAWHGPWCWERLVPELERRGWATSAVDLPSTWGNPDTGMRDDAQAVREHVESIDGPVTVLAHSYGGVPVSEVADTLPNVRQLVYLAAHMLEADEAVTSPLGGPWFPLEAETAPHLPPHDAFYHDVPAEWAAEAVARLRPQSARVFLDEQTRASWRTIPSALIVCDDDRSICSSSARCGAPRSSGTSPAAIRRSSPGPSSSRTRSTRSPSPSPPSPASEFPDGTGKARRTPLSRWRDGDPSRKMNR